MDKKFKNFQKFLDVKQTFLELTRHTVPERKEIEYLSDILPKDLIEDKIGNLYIKIGKSNTMFTSHMDTVYGDSPVKHDIKGNMIGTDGTTILGADDKAGMTIMLYMIAKKIPGLYYFFIGEEHGQIGSNARDGLAGYVKDNKDTDDRFKDINKVVSFDRADYNSVITFQHGERCCSNEFGDALAKELNDKGGFKYVKDEGGVLTDSIHFTTIYPECTNLSVGYFNQHANTERQDIEFLARLCEASCKVNWEDLPIKRDPSKVESKYYGYSDHWYGGYQGTQRNKRYWDEYFYDDDGGYDSGYNSVSTADRQKKSKRVGNKVKDYTGNLIFASDAVWCEYDKEYCLKKDAIWEDIVGFYSVPDTAKSSTIPESKSKPLKRKLKEKDFQVGLKAHHKVFGYGVIKEWTPDKVRLIVDFEDRKIGRKTIHFPIGGIQMTF